MFLDLLQKVFGSHNDRMVKKFRPLVDKINALEPAYEKLKDADLQALTQTYKDRLKAGETLDDLLPEAFASVREAAKRTLGQRHYDVQLIGGIILHKGMISEMMTGEGKTLVSTLPCYLNALTGKGVHVVTVNDYLAHRDAQWMGQVHRFLGLTVGTILNSMDDNDRRAAYACDITYATNNELGFDYLRDNMKFSLEDMVQRDFHFAIVDEVDSILIDEARTPLIISGPAEDSSELYLAADKVIPQLQEGDYEKEEKSRSITLTEQGSQRIEDVLEAMGLLKGASLYDLQNISLVHHINQALRAHKVFNRDVDYIVKDDKLIIIDEFTGRMMEGRRYSDGLHQALEAKEKVTIQMENQTLASITFQNYFRMYEKLAGMTGTAKTEAAEFADIYNLEVVQIPTNVSVARQDKDDEVYRTEREKIDAIVKLIKDVHARQQPILVGTVSIEKSEQLSDYLKAAKIPHQVLNARYHEMEATIIAQAGKPGAVTIATNMAGRGTDIKLGGNLEMRLEQELDGVEDTKKRAEITKNIRDEITKAEALVKEAGGLFVIGTERHESRRIDNQLRGRSGRQGDPGSSQFFLSLQDELMRRFGSDRLEAMLVRLGLEEGEAITHPWVNKALERAQQKVEAYNFEIRKHLLRYDNVMNDQRKVIYEQRREIMATQDSSELLKDMISDVLEETVSQHIPQNTYVDQWNINGLHEECLRLFALDLPIEAWCQEEGIADREIMDRIEKAVAEHFTTKEGRFGEQVMRYAERNILMRVLDQSWKDHLHSLDHLRQGIGLRGYAQRDPLNEYKQEAFNMFHEMLGRVRHTIVSLLSHLEVSVEPDEAEMENPFEDMEAPADVSYFGPGLATPEPDFQEGTVKNKSIKERLSQARKTPAPKKAKATPAKALKSSNASAVTTDAFEGEEVPRNALCPCGSGKRFKHCHGAVEAETI